MSLHVFIGAGPANLHRALKIQNMEPNAKFVFIDDRLNPETRSIDRLRARANIFRFETEDVTAKLLADGVKEEDLKPLVCQRDFSVKQGFQLGDDEVFSNKPFTQIQIRDLQLLLLKTIDDKSGENKPLLLKHKIDLDSGTSLEEGVAGLLYQNNIAPEDLSTLKIHVAVGALSGDPQKNEITYPDKVTYKIDTPTDDLAAMTVTPLHGTTTFLLNDNVTVERLVKNQRSLDLTPWADALQKFGWALVRPPRIRVFYANDILYIGTELPWNMLSLPKEQFETQITNYTRQIASLVFPDLPINSLEVNPYLQSRFFTSRGERGDVISNKFHQKLPFGTHSIDANITTLIHGDSRYLPHYQTGSGFITAFLQNELYAEIYVHHSFDELINWAIDKNHLDKNIDKEELKTKYLSLVSGELNLALEAFKQELFMAVSRQIIEENKQKVARYFNVLHAQGFDYKEQALSHLEAAYNNHHGTNLSLAETISHHSNYYLRIPRKYFIMRLLSTGNIEFLRFILPKLLNMNFTELSDRELLHIRDIHLLDFKESLDMKRFTTEDIDYFLGGLRTDERIKQLDQGVEQFDTLLKYYNEAYQLHYKVEDFSQASKKVMIMEMLNNKEDNILFLRRAFALLSPQYLSTWNDKDVLRQRNWFTSNYTAILGDFYSSIITESRLKNNEDKLIKNLASGDNKCFLKACEQLSLPKINKESDAHQLRINLLYTTIFQTQSHNKFYNNLQAMIKSNNHINDPIQIAYALENNDALYQRDALPFFKGKHSELIKQFVKDMKAILDNDTYSHPSLYYKQQLNIIMTFYSSLERAKSKRTLKMLEDLVNQAYSPASNRFSIPLRWESEVYHYDLILTSTEKDKLIYNLASGDPDYFDKLHKQMRLPPLFRPSRAEREAEYARMLYGVLSVMETTNPFHKNMQEMIKNGGNILNILQKVAQSLKENERLHHRDLISLLKGKHSEAINKFANDINGLTSIYIPISKQQANEKALSIVMKFHSDLEKAHSRRTLNELNDLINHELSKFRLTP